MDNNLTDLSSAGSTTSQRFLETEMLLSRCATLVAILSREKLSKEQRSKYIAEAVITGFELGQRLSAAELTEALFGWVGVSVPSTGINSILWPTISQESTCKSQSYRAMGQREDSEAFSTGLDEE
jgi:hypothetical protein